MEIPRSAQSSSPTSSQGSTLRFAEVARRLGAAAHANGLAVPAFRCPPRTAGATRTIRRYPGGTVVSVRLRDRPFSTVVSDMVDGVLAANRVAAPDEPRLRASLHAAIGGVVAQDAHTARSTDVVDVTDEQVARAA